MAKKPSQTTAKSKPTATSKPTSTPQSSNRPVKAKSDKKPTSTKRRQIKLPRNILTLITNKWFRRLGFMVGLLVVLVCALYYSIYKDLPSPQKLQITNFPASTLMYDRTGHLLYEIYADQNRIPVTLEEIPTYVKQATIAIEDKDFYNHQGLAIIGIIRALFKNSHYISCQIPLINNLVSAVTGCNVVFQGGSTITQQLVKNALLSPERTVERKLKELILTISVETLYSKDEILEMYLNQIPYGGTAYGLEAASQTYFGKHAKDLTLAQATILAGLPQAPTRYSPFGANPELYKERQSAVIRRMLEDGYITSEQAEQIQNETIEFADQTNIINAPHFVLWVKELLVEKYGSQMVETGGLRVTTSLDLSLQEYAQATVAAEIADLEDYQVSNGAALITNPSTGEVLAMVGSANYYNNDIDGKVNVTLRYRQPGSSIKPLNYTIAFDQGLAAPGSIIADLPTCFNSIGSPPYCPKNYDGSFRGRTTVRAALANSYNIPAVKLLALNGMRNFINIASRMGIQGWDDPSRYGLSLTLGGGEVRMTDLAVAYGTIANLGVKVPLHPILKVTEASGRVIEEFNCQTPDLAELTQSNYHTRLPADCEAERVMEPVAPYLTTHILSDQAARSPTFGSNLNIRGRPEVAVKTGTTNELRDNWTVGYTPTRLTAVWVGNNDNSQMSRIASGITGAAPIWSELMTKALEDQSTIKLNPPTDVIGTNICSLTGMLPTDGCPTTFDLFPKSLVPTDVATITRDWPIDKTTGGPAQPDTPPENWEMQTKQIVFDILGDPICLDCPVETQGTNMKFPYTAPQNPATVTTQSPGLPPENNEQ